MPGLPPGPVTSHKQAIRPAAGTDRSGTIDDAAVLRPAAAVGEAVAVAEAHHVDVLLPFATSCVRDAADRRAVLAEVRAATGVEVSHMDGEEEARLTFLSARGWYGWSAGTLLLLDIGGGSLEIAHGPGREPVFAVSLPLGAGRLTRDHLPAGGPSRGEDVKAPRRHVRSVLARPAAVVGGLPRPDLSVAASKTFTQLACLTGAPRPEAGPQVPRTLDRAALAGGSHGRRPCPPPTARGCPGSRRPAPGRSSPAPSSRRRSWTCSASSVSRCAPGRSARGSCCTACGSRRACSLDTLSRCGRPRAWPEGREGRLWHVCPGELPSS